MTKPTRDIEMDNWVFVIQNLDGDNPRIGLKINGEWAYPELAKFEITSEGEAEIALQWEEYDRRGSPFMSYQKISSKPPLTLPE
jgi:hypothetical protein